MKYFIYTIIAIVTVAVVAGFFIVGSPREERSRRFDQQRIEHLQLLQSELINYWMNKAKLPANLSLLKDDLRGITIPTDPESNQSYVYKVLGPLKFQLCASFNLPSLSTVYTNEGKPMPIDPYYAGQNWSHDAGQVCFDRTIDKDFYQPVKPAAAGKPAW
ncbi:MAG: hypothetical protein G01um10143_113 [Parcubacteria group bacterium Gr01-1014_3]|nr:MAG: hypothetical protein G01um10143_113 [Parcubacteria group bacterium Gr01-1014_3]